MLIYTVPDVAAARTFVQALPLAHADLLDLEQILPSTMPLETPQRA